MLFIWKVWKETESWQSSSHGSLNTRLETFLSQSSHLPVSAPSMFQAVWRKHQRGREVFEADTGVIISRLLEFSRLPGFRWVAVGITAGRQSLLKLSWKRKGSECHLGATGGARAQSLEGTWGWGEATADGCGEVPVSSAANQGTPLLIPSWEVTAIALSSSINESAAARQPPLDLLFKSVTYFQVWWHLPYHLIVYLRFTLWFVQCWLPKSSRDCLDHCVC